MIQILLALIAGMLTIAAPCILLPLPIIFGGSVGQKSRTRPLFITFGFVLSFASVALLINFLVQTLGLDPNTLRTGAVIMLALFAFFMIWPTPFEKLMAHMSGLITSASRTGQSAGSGNIGGFILGLIIGIIWAPCAGPILGSILTLIALEKNTGQAFFLLISYAIGAGIPMLAIAYGGQALTTKVKGIAKYSQRLQQIFGVILILLAGAIYFQYDTIIQAKLVEKFPGLGTAFEQSLVDGFSKDDLKNDTKSSDKMGNSELKNLGKAPEFTGISNWLNSDLQTLASLKGKVVLIDFWTYSCINCVRTLPYVTKWYDTYKDQGFVVIGVHTPEFAFEKETANVATAIQRHGINYPVAQDNAFGTWRAYDNQYWPAEYLIDQNGNIVYTHFGEGNYDVTENAIRELLGLGGAVKADNSQNLRNVGSPEMYFGTERIEYLTADQTASPAAQIYTVPQSLKLNTFALGGEWKFEGQKTTLTKDNGKIVLHFRSGKLYMVAQSTAPQTIQITVDGVKQPDVKVGVSDLYTLFDSNDYKDHTVEIAIPKAGFEAFTFTFG